MKRRILALLLCLSMLLPLFTGSVIANGSGDYGSNVGRYAVLSDTYQGVFVGSFTDISTESSEFLYLSDFEPGTIFKITDWYVEPGTSGLWYGVEVYSGGVLPEAQEYWPAIPWILQDYLGEAAEGDSLIFIDVCDTCGKPNCGGHDSTDFTTIYLNGVEVTQITMPQFDKPTLSATTTLEGNVSCRWQILADAESGFWVNIYGENSPELTLSYGMVASLLDSNNQAWVRCVTSAGGTEVISDALPITLEPYVAPSASAYPAPIVPSEPTEPVEEPSEPTEPVEEPSESTEPVEESSEPTEPVEKPSEPTEPAEESSEPTEPVEKPSEPTEPAEESSEPTEPVEKPSEPTEPAEESSEPTEVPTQPIETVSETADAPSKPAGVHHMTQDAMRLLPLEQRIPSSASALEEGTHDIVVTYIFRDTGTTAAPNYTATVGHGDSFTETVTFPTVPGYEPIVIINGAEVQRDDYTFNIASVTEDHALVVMYQPALVPYRVYIYMQNVENDSYPLNPVVESGMAYTGSTNYEYTLDMTKYGGFYPLPYEKPAIAADGSTAVNIYLDRYYYLMLFDLGGGYGVEPIYARFGAPIEAGVPSRPGYDFTGWLDAKGNAATIPDTMPIKGGTYTAVWKPTPLTNYAVTYWTINDDGTRSLIGTRVETGTAGQTVDGKDDLESSIICGNETTHTHSADCYSCCQDGNTHGYNCFTNLIRNYPNPDGENVINNLENGNGPQSGYVYVIKTATGNLWPKIYLDGNYYAFSGIGSDTVPATQDQVDSIIEGSLLGEGAYSNLTVTKYKPNIALHANVNVICNEHIHSDDCKLEDTTYLEHVESRTVTKPDGTQVTYTTDQDVVIKGDGTSVVNVYYQYKQYELKFYYAATTGGTATDNDKNPGTYDTIKVVGGSTWHFGTLAETKTDNDEILLEYMYSKQSGQWGEITALPSLNATGTARNYTHGATKVTINGAEVSFHFISFKARYGDDISGMWPCAVFNSATRTTANTHNYWSGTEAFVSAWNGEPFVKYTCNQKINNGNETIKGRYERLDEKLLFDPTYANQHATQYNDSVISYLCFWENGANISWSVPELYRYNIYLQAYSGQDLTGKTTVTRNGTTYYLANSYDTCDDSNVDKQTQVSLTGYDNADRDSSEIKDFDTSLYKEAYNVDFYYDAQIYTLRFWNHSNYLTNGTGVEVAYNEPLERYFEGTATAEGANDLVVKPENYPSTLEPDAYEFEGWYTSSHFESETHVDPTHMTMPDEDLMVYAHWVPKIHHVRLFLTEDHANDASTHLEEFQISHGQMVPEEQWPETPTNGNYQFIGWFYQENGREMAFDFASMPIKDGMNLYAKWSSNVLVTYTVQYLEEGTLNPVAPETTGSGLAGITKTFDAAEALDGWFPTVKSHNMLLDVDETNNVCTFYYVQQPAVPYTVRYVTMNDQGIYVDLSNLDIPGAPATKEVADNKKAVVTENFVPVPGYLPDASRKTLVVSADGVDNVITFVYTYDEVNGYYVVSDWLQDTNGTTWTQEIREEGSGRIGTSYSRNPFTIPGFTYDADNSNNRSSGTLVKNDILKLNFYYTRNKYPYQIQYLEFGTETVLKDPITYKDDYAAYYGESVNAEGKPPPAIDGYRLHSVVGCTIGIETNVESLSHNVVKVYYTPVTGNLQITKRINIINDNAPDPSDQEFEFLVAVPNGVTGTYPVTIGENTENITVTDGKIKVNLKDGESAVIADLPQGPSTNKHQYTITETPVPGFKSSFSPAGPYTVSDGNTTSVTCTNEYPIGNLEITKKVEKEYPGDAWTDDTFGFTITSDDLPNGKAYKVMVGDSENTLWVSNHTITVPDVALTSETSEVTISIPNIPTGSYTVAEQQTSAIAATYSTTANGSTGYSATVDVTASDTPAAVNFVNTVKRTTGDFYISKNIEIVPDSGATLDPNAEFTFIVQMPNDQPASHFAEETYTVQEHSTIREVTVGNDGKFTFTLKHGEHLIIKDLPVGSYVVTETPTKGYASSFPIPNPVDGSVSETVTITTNTQAKLDCVNTYPVHVGNLKITKTIQNESGLDKELDDTFTFTIEFTVMGNNLTFPVTYSPSETTETLTAVRNGEKAVLTVKLKDGQSVLIKKLPEGACTVTETNIPTNYTAEYSGSITIAPDQTQTLAVVNKYKPPTLTIQKTNAEAGQVFVYEVKDTNGKIITVTVTGNGSTTIHDLVPGTYTVTQKNLWSWRYGDTAQTVTLPAEGATVKFEDSVLADKDSWLDGNSALVRNQKAGG